MKQGYNNPWLKALKMIPIVLEERNQQLSRQHPAASQNAAQPPSACRPHAIIATSLRGVAKAPLGEVSGAAELPPFKVFHSKTIDHWLTTRGLWFCGAHPFAPSAAVTLSLTVPRPSSFSLAPVFFIARSRRLRLAAWPKHPLARSAARQICFPPRFVGAPSTKRGAAFLLTLTRREHT